MSVKRDLRQVPVSIYWNMEDEMDKEIKSAFDAALYKVLSEVRCESVVIKASKKGLKINSFFDKENFGELKFDFLAGQKAYYFGMTGWSMAFGEFVADVAPPYGSNHPEGFDHHFFMSTIMENRGLYSRGDGKIYLPEKVGTISEICSHIENCLNEFYVPWLRSFVNFSPDLIGRVIQRPEFYSFPAPLIAFVLKVNNLHWEDVKVDLSRGVLRNKAFDTRLIGSI